MNISEYDLEALAGLGDFWAGTPAFKTFARIGPLPIYAASLKLVLASQAWREVEEIARRFKTDSGGYSIGCWTGNVADVFRAVERDERQVPQSIDHWAAAIFNEFRLNHEASPIRAILQGGAS